MNRVMKRNWKHVGRLKSGWLNSSTYFAKKINKQPKAPAWVKRHGKNEGSAKQMISASSGYNLTGVNKVPYVDNTGAVQKAVDITKRRMVKHLEKKTHFVLKKRIERFNKKAA